MDVAFGDLIQKRLKCVLLWRDRLDLNHIIDDFDLDERALRDMGLLGERFGNTQREAVAPLEKRLDP